MANYLFTPVAMTLGAPDNNTTLSVLLASTTIINVTLTSGISIVGLAATGGNVDGMVVCFSNISATALTLGLANLSGSALPVNQFRHHGGAAASLTQYGAVWYRYTAAELRWQEIARLT